jgi:hypothetical protein
VVVVGGFESQEVWIHAAVQVRLQRPQKIGPNIAGGGGHKGLKDSSDHTET